jgi:3-dehydroquinate synthase
VLNFGHTAGHAIESYFLKKKKHLLHGEAIAMGMAVEVCLGKQIGRTEPKTALQVFQLLKKHYVLKKFSRQEIKIFVNLIKQDKKNQSGRMNFALIEKPGKALINIYASAEEIREAFHLYNNLLS